MNAKWKEIRKSLKNMNAKWKEIQKSLKKLIKKLLLLVLLLVVAYMFYCCVNPIPKYSEKELIQVLDSPDGKKKLNIYLGPPEWAIMVDDYIVGEVEFLDHLFRKKKVIYSKYHTDLEEAKWLDNERVLINRKVMDIYNSETWVYIK